MIFIVLDRCHQEGANYEMLPMIGDVNMVLKDADDNKQQGLLAEMMLMIAGEFCAPLSVKPCTLI